jgi:sporulation-control protein
MRIGEQSMVKQFLSSIGYGTMTVDTIVDAPNIAFGETLSGKIYIDGENSEELIDHIDLELLKRTEEDREDSDFLVIEDVIAKHSIEMVNTLKSKETSMIPFEMVPDARWDTASEKETLILRTTVHINNVFNVQDEDRITYG